MSTFRSRQLREQKRTSPWRIGILGGTGTALKRTIPALIDSEICRAAVVHGRSNLRLAEVLALDPAIRVTASEEEFVSLRDQYDIVYVASPPFLHLTHVRLATRLGLPLICEKPLVSDHTELRAIVKLIEDSGVPFMLAHHTRHQCAVSDVAKIVACKRFGSPVAAHLQWCFVMDHEARNATWKLRPTLGGSNALFDSGVHAIDLAVLLFGSPESVSAFGHHVRSADAFDSVVAVLQYPELAVTIVASQSASSHANDLTITFPSAVLRVGALFGEKSARTLDIASASGTTQLTYEPVNLYRAEVENFCHSLGGAGTSGTTLREAAVTTDILAAAEKAIRMERLILL